MYEDQIPTELVVGNIYSGEEIRYYTHRFGDEKVFIVSNIDVLDHINFRVTQVLDRKTVSYRKNGNFHHGTFMADKTVILLERLSEVIGGSPYQ